MIDVQAAPRHVLVTGATGCLGRSAVAMLLERGVKVSATGRNLEVGALLAAAGAEFIALDLVSGRPLQMERLLDGIDDIWHCAGLSAHASCHVGRRRALHGNGRESHRQGTGIDGL